MNSNTDQLAVCIIANAGESKSLALEAIEAAKQKDFTNAEELLKQSKQTRLEAHKAHYELISLDAKEGVKVSMLLVHASNHLSVAEVTVQFAETIIDLLKERR